MSQGSYTNDENRYAKEPQSSFSWENGMISINENAKTPGRNNAKNDNTLCDFALNRRYTLYTIKNSPKRVSVIHIRTNMRTAGMNRERYFQLLDKVK